MEQPNGQRVTNIELFFDLVFVFTITQVTELVARAAGPPDLLRAALALMTIWWMYGGYAWLTNNVDADRPRVRLLLLAAMGGFLAMALAVPRLFAGDGWAFGAGYLLINALHAALFAHAPNPDSAQAIWRVAPINLGTALAVLISAWLPPAWRDGLWGAALLVLLVLPWTRKPTGFALAPAHFVERHGLVILIALGESVVAIGLGSAGAALTLPLLGRALLILALLASLWWVYFDLAPGRIEAALERLERPARASAALYAFGYAHLAMVAGIVVLAAGMKRYLTGAPAEAGALALASGAALYFAGAALFRRVLGLGAVGGLLALAALAAALAPLGGLLGDAALIAALLGLGCVWLLAGRGRQPA